MNDREMLIRVYASIKCGWVEEEALEEYLLDTLDIPKYDEITDGINNKYGIGLTDEQFRELIYEEYIKQIKPREE
jgi:hypothetical protein